MGTDIHMAIEVRQADGSWRWERNAAACRWCEGTKSLGYESKRPCYCTKEAGAVPGRGHGYGRRNYDAFGVLANVRNGTWGKPTPFIAEPRGLPADMDPVLGREHESDREAGYSLGDHSFSHVTLAELLAFEWWHPLSRSAIIGWQEFVAWDRQTPPKSYCAGAGRVIQQATADDMIGAGVEPKEFCNVQVTWTETIAAAMGAFYESFIPSLVELARNKNVEPTGVRLVFGFDS